MTDNPDLFDHIKYYSLPFTSKLMLVRYGKQLDVFKNDPDPTISELAKTILDADPGLIYPIHVTLASDLDYDEGDE